MFSFLGAIELNYSSDTFTQHFTTFGSNGVKITSIFRDVVTARQFLPLDHYYAIFNEVFNDASGIFCT